MADRRFAHSTRYTIGPDRDDDLTPCFGKSEPFDALAHHNHGPAWRAAYEQVAKLCGSCPIQPACYRDNRSEPWALSLAGGGVRKEPDPEPTPAGEALRARHAAARAARHEEVKHILDRGGDVGDACAHLGMTRSALWKWCRKYAWAEWTALSANEQRRAVA